MSRIRMEMSAQVLAIERYLNNHVLMVLTSEVISVHNRGGCN